MIYKKRFPENTINQLSRDVVEVYEMLSQKKMKLNDIVNKISKDVGIAKNSVLQILQQNEYI